MNALDLLGDLYRLGVTLVIGDGQIRLRAPRGVITNEMRALLTEHKATIINLLGDGEFPDVALPDEIYIPPDVPNTVEAIRECIYSQRIQRAA